MLSVGDLSKRFGDRLVLDRVSFTVNPGDRLGLVGPNGAGKSTLLALIAGKATPDGGRVALAPGVRLGLLRQGFADRPRETLGGLLAGTGGRVGSLLAAHDRLDAVAAGLSGPDREPALARYDDALVAFEAAGGYAAVDDLGGLLDALGLAGIPLATPLTALSGGQRTRAGLAALLADRPDLLLLDEPTNHLDGDALAWLEAFLAGYRGAVLVVSHDRAFLDRAATVILELDGVGGRLSAYPGGYSDYLAAKRRDADSHRAAFDRQQQRIARIEQDVRTVASHAEATQRATQNDFLRGRAKKVARTAKVRERKLERLLASEERIDKPERSWGLALDFGPRPETGRDVARIEDASVNLGGRPVLREIDLQVRFGERVVLTGPNGGGKSTLVRLLAGDLAPDAGTVRLGAGVIVGRYDQEQAGVDPVRSVLDQARAAAAAPLSETDARSFLHRFLFGGDAVFRPGGALSYGERARLALALLILRGANFLLLDEPLNHLDLPSRERFEEALAGFAGTSLLVLHDRFAIERLADRVLELRDGRLREAGERSPRSSPR